MSCCPVAVKLGIQSFIFAVDLKCFRVGVYRVISFLLLLVISVCTLCYLPQDLLSLFLKTHHVSVNDLVMSYTTLGG